MIVGGMTTIKEEVGSKVSDDTRGSNVQKMISSMEGFDPEGC
jgi:hypothetical protein